MPEDETYIAFRYIRSTRNISSNGQNDALRSVGSDYLFEAREDEAKATLTEVLDKVEVEPLIALDLGLQALPWTAVAEDEVVSELVSQYFATDHLYVYRPIPRSKFLREMKVGDPDTATCCSPLLANAICAHQCTLSPKAHLGAVPRGDMTERFLVESNRLLQNESSRGVLGVLPSCLLDTCRRATRDQLEVVLDVEADSFKSESEAVTKTAGAGQGLDEWRMCAES
ncbi:hypothetical protein VFPPC_11474 [Pochonia chlamydosporia 170]|uniref:Uncharacterized protein n=1 Tax=Pochonia chlamydosporia 170 TaxID=1380566 RepID=A0A179F1J0_METCM|nr:hypothetical protein VFPPC_11474 [Pochonia chlamydosporia 170]OAQ58979.1 hypothetical protein VFPPC_11474 [Pochonia chlamydosporia 170]